MLKIHFVLNSFIWNYVKDGVILLAALTAAVIILSAVFTVIELRKNKAVSANGREEDAAVSAPADGDMPAADNTD